MLDHRVAGKPELAGHLHALVAGGDGGEPMPVSMLWRSAPSSPQRKSRCHQERRNSPSVTACRPTSSCILITRSISRSSTALSSAARSRLWRATPAPLSVRRAQQAADVLGTERRLGSFHGATPTLSPSCPRKRASISQKPRCQAPWFPAFAGTTARTTNAVIPRPLRRPPQSAAASPTARPRPGYYLLGGGEAALRREAELVEVDEPRGLVDAALELVLAFQRTALRVRSPSTTILPLGRNAGARSRRRVAVVFQEIAVTLISLNRISATGS